VRRDQLVGILVAVGVSLAVAGLVYLVAAGELSLEDDSDISCR